MLKSPAYASFTHNAARIAIGLLFWSHGAQKLLGWFGGVGPDGGTAPLMSRFGIAGIIEFFGGLAIMSGTFTQPIAFIIAGEMAVAYFWAHTMGRGTFWWWANRGELPAVYSWFFLWLSAVGAGTFSVDAWLKRRKASTPAPVA